MSLSVVQYDGNEPITIFEAQTQCYIDESESDNQIISLLDRLTSAARRHGEARTWRTLRDATINWKLDEFPEGIIEVPGAPLISVESIKYIDTDGAEQTVDSSDYRVDSDSEPGRIEVVDSWPTIKDQINAVTIQFKAGYGDDFPEDLKIGLLMALKFLYDNRDSHIVMDRSGEVLEMPMGANLFIDSYSMRTP